MLWKRFILPTLLYFLLFVLFSGFFLNLIPLEYSDLGRHIINGKVFFTDQRNQMLWTNFYSYIQKDHSFINHHWLSGVAFYLVYASLGFKGLSLLFAVFGGFASLMLFVIGKRLVGSGYSLLFLTIFLILSLLRPEVRPEMFSVFFFILFSYLILISKSDLRLRILLLIPLQIIWVNTHILFFYAFILCLAHLVSGKLEGNSRKFREGLIILIVLVLSSLINPFGIRGVLEPLRIFTQYGIGVEENQPIANLISSGYYYYFIFFGLCMFIGELAAFFSIKKSGLKRNSDFILLFFFFMIFTLVISRSIQFFGIALFLLLVKTVNEYNINLVSMDRKRFTLYIYIFFGVLVAVRLWHTGIGITDAVQASANFYIQHNIKGPLFNDFDIGSYLIFRLYGKERVFIDNRPEAYSKDFEENVYAPMLSDEAKWKFYSDQYKFRSIFIRKSAVTNSFIGRRLKDDNWTLAFKDEYAYIFVR